ncbi:881_t:CDS:1, partial [Funneliformis geosporum]
QAFSIAKNTISQIRNRLDPQKAQVSLCLKTWIDSELITSQNI